MRNDPKIKRLISKYGIEGYGWYCLILESISENITTASPMPELEETSDDLADFYHGNSAKIQEIVAFMSQTGLLEYNEVSNQVTCHKIYKLLEANQTRSEAIRQLIASYKSNNAQLPPPSETVTDKSERKEKKRKDQEEEKTVVGEQKNPWIFQEKWNSFKHLPEFKRIRGNVTTTELEAIRLACEPYSISEIERAISNYGIITANKQDYIFVPDYTTLISFLSKGVEVCSGDISRFIKNKHVKTESDKKPFIPRLNPEVEAMKREREQND